MLTLTAPTLRKTPTEVQEIQDRTDRLVKEAMETKWPTKPPKYDQWKYPLTVEGPVGKVHMLFETREQHEHADRELRVNANAALQRGIFNRNMRAKIDELAEIESQTASTGELN